MKKGTLQYEPGNYEGGVRLDYVFSVDGTIKFLMEAKKPAILHVANARTEENGHGTVNLSWGDPDSQPPTLHEKILALVRKLSMIYHAHYNCSVRHSAQYIWRPSR